MWETIKERGEKENMKCEECLVFARCRIKLLTRINDYVDRKVFPFPDFRGVVMEAINDETIESCQYANDDQTDGTYSKQFDSMGDLYKDLLVKYNIVNEIKNIRRILP